ncbi:odorant receptor 118 [Nasonia vitripennis]|uniref:Odorant receptor n=1 Tax=Nasonia vitripennis TaxID=7425 RepID=A0A7M6UGA2_NASVI|nr:odorant receptor 118 [Nasonia vitripennis]
MDLLPMHFRTFRFFGLWYDDPRSYGLAKLVHRSLVVILIVHMSLFQMIALFSVKHSVDEYTNTLFIALTYFVNIYKILAFMAKNRSVNEMLDKFRLDVCRTRDAEEERILAQYLHTANWTYSARMILTLCTGVIQIVVPFLIGYFTGKVGLLPFDTFFFNVEDLAQYALVYALQAVAIVTVVITDVTLDSTPCACMILACAQLEICRYRIKHDNNVIANEVTGDGEMNSECKPGKELREKMALKKYVKHYVLMREIVDRIQSVFISIVLPIFCSALLTLCFSTFQLAQKNQTTGEYCFIITYLCCLLVQIFCLCWFGNELQFKGEIVSNAVYETDWTVMKPRIKKSYWYLMFMGQNKFIISFHGQCTLTLQTFIWMIKASYGAFNLLNQVADTKY